MFEIQLVITIDNKVYDRKFNNIIQLPVKHDERSTDSMFLFLF